MKQRLFSTFILIFAFVANAKAQFILKGADEIEGKIGDGYLMFFKVDEKNIQKEWKDFLSAYGRVSESKGGLYNVSNFSEPSITNGDKVNLMSKIVTYKDYVKVFCTFAQPREVNDENARQFLEKFYLQAAHNDAVRMAKLDLAWAEDQLKSAENNAKRIEKSLESNLSEQEKLGKKIDQTPEELVKIIGEKQEMLDKRLTATGEDSVALDKKLASKEKEINSTQKQKVKNQKRLSKKEADFDKLSEKLFEAKRQVRFNEELVKAKQLIVKKAE